MSTVGQPEHSPGRVRQRDPPMRDSSLETAVPTMASPGETVSLERLMDRAPHAVAVVEGEGYILRSVNPAFCQLLKLSAADLLGRPFAEVMGDEAPVALFDSVRRSGEAVGDSELPGRDSGSGAPLWSYSVWRAPDGSEGDNALMIEIRDRTAAAESRQRLEEMAEQIRQINERLLSSALREQRSAERAEAAARAKTDFLAMMSHELRTPLTGIVGFTDVLDAEIGGPITQSQRETLNRIRRCSAQLLELIDDILSFAKVEAQGTEVLRERVDLCSLGREAAAIMQPVVAQKGVNLLVRTPTMPLAIETDARKVRQILLNLLSNAAKFTEQGEIRLEVWEDDTAAFLEVKDTGIGIEAGDLERVFEPFVQTEAVLTRRHGGTGLGLAISRALATLIRGVLTAESTPGRGSTFILRLPRSAAAASPGP